MFLIAVSFSACTADIYAPTPHQVYLFEEKGELIVEGNTGNSGFNFQLAYALSDVIGLGVYGAFMDKDNTNYAEGSGDKEEYFKNRKYFEGALIFRAYRDEYIHLGMLLSYGLGRGEEKSRFTFDSSTSGAYGYGEYNKYSFQTNIAYIKNNFETGFSPKISYIDFTDVEQSGEQFFNPDNLQEWFWEPAYFMRYGTEVLKFEFQVGTTQALDNVGFGYERVFYSLGIQLNFKTY